MSDRFIQYNHHGNYVWVKKGNKDKHRENCLCWSCNKLNTEDREKNCPIANAVFKNCVDFGIVTPIWECKEFREIEFDTV